MADLDQFDDVNEAFGYAAADGLLRAVGERLRQCVRRSGATVARVGGDGFAIVLPRTGRRGAERSARSLARLLERPFTVDGHPVTANATTGIALSREHGVDADVLVRRATTAMQTAKRAGTPYAVYAPAHERHRARFLLVNELRQALARDELFLHYQPVVGLLHGEVIAVEALARWAHPTRGPIGPGEFVPFAERGRLGGALRRWVIATALRAARRWTDEGSPLLERPSTSLVIGGPYRRSRNPIYLALAGAQLGLGLALGSPWIVGLTPPAMALMTVVVIQREERYLGSRFGRSYADYRVRVRRWL